MNQHPPLLSRSVAFARNPVSDSHFALIFVQFSGFFSLWLFCYGSCSIKDIYVAKNFHLGAFDFVEKRLEKKKCLVTLVFSSLIHGCKANLHKWSYEPWNRRYLDSYPSFDFKEYMLNFDFWNSSFSFWCSLIQIKHYWIVSPSEIYHRFSQSWMLLAALLTRMRSNLYWTSLIPILVMKSISRPFSEWVPLSGLQVPLAFD